MELYCEVPDPFSILPIVNKNLMAGASAATLQS